VPGVAKTRRNGAHRFVAEEGRGQENDLRIGKAGVVFPKGTNRGSKLRSLGLPASPNEHLSCLLSKASHGRPNQNERSTQFHAWRRLREKVRTPFRLVGKRSDFGSVLRRWPGCRVLPRLAWVERESRPMAGLFRVRLIMSVTAWRSHSREHGDDRGRNWGWFWAAAEGRFCETVARECCPGGLKAHQADRG